MPNGHQKRDLGAIQKCREEWVGDAALRYAIRHAICVLHPNEGSDELACRAGIIESNRVLSGFCKSRGWPFRCNGLEREVGKFFREGKIENAMELALNLIAYVESKPELELDFRSRMIGNMSRKYKLRPLPCICGSMNIRVWQKPPQIVCHDCGYELRVSTEERLKATAVIEGWNTARQQQQTAA